MNSIKHNSSGGFAGRGILRLYASCIVPVSLLLFVGVTLIMLEWIYGSAGSGFTSGAPSPRTYNAIAPMKFVDLPAAERLRDMAGQSVAGVLVRDVAAPERMKSRLAELRSISDPAAKLSAEWSEELLEAFRALSEEKRQELLLFADRIGSAYFEKLASGDFKATADGDVALWAEIDRLNLASGEENLLYQLLAETIDPGYKIEPRLTETMREIVGESVPPVERTLEVGDVIVEHGMIITPQIARLLKLQGYVESVFPLTQLVIVCLLILLLPLWLEMYASERRGDRLSWKPVVFVTVLAWTGEAAALQMGIPGAGVLTAVTMACLCIPRRFLFSVCLAATFSGVFLITGLSVYNMLLIMSLSFLASLAGFYLFRRIGSREDLGIKVFSLAVFLVIARTTIFWIQGFPLAWRVLGVNPPGVAWRFLFFDLASTFLAVSLLPLIEKYIDVLSALTTRELSHPSSALLRKLQAEAPGTYHHCLMIGTLAEAVAEDLGMDENLMKMGAYYHDIGKLRRPRFFVENQMGGENIHDSMSPTLSALAILDHVREGVELANEFGLPKKVKEFITEHHGTTCMTYFYKKALALGEIVDPEQFCYPGPKPGSRETALLMLLDSTEAAMRAESKNIQSIEDIREIVSRVTAIKIKDKQLENVDFTFREMSSIEKALLKAFQSMYHTRKVKEIKKENFTKGKTEK